MAVIYCFLAMEEDKPLGIWWADDRGCGVIDLDDFLLESLIDLSPEQARRYREKFNKFCDKLEELEREEDHG